MPFPAQILASSEEPFIKVVVGAIVAVFWLIGAIVSAVNKKAEEAKRRQMIGQIPQQAAAIPSLPRAAKTPRPVIAVAPKTKPANRPVAVRQSYAAPTAPAIEAMPSSNLSRVAVATQVTHQQPESNAVPPNQIGRLLRRPDTLRAAFILNEVLSPPLSARQEAGGRG